LQENAMKTAVIALAIVLCAATPPQDDAEAKKKRLGEIFSQSLKLQKEAEALMKELTGGDRGKQEAVMREIMEKYAPEMAEQFNRALTMSNERTASVTLKTLATAEADFRANDRDANHENDFWVADVSGLYRLFANGDMLKLIEMSVALADARPTIPLDSTGALPSDAKTKLQFLGKAATKAGYQFAAIEKYEEDGAIQKYDEGKGRNPSRFGFCAYPAAYPANGKMTFVITENNTVFRKDTGGKRVEQWSSNPQKDGWQRDN
jgi:hypothetical protein